MAQLTFEVTIVSELCEQNQRAGVVELAWPLHGERKRRIDRGILEKVKINTCRIPKHRLLKYQTPSHDHHEHRYAQGDLHLALGGILRGAGKRIDPQLLLDPFEQMTDILPSRPCMAKS